MLSLVLCVPALAATGTISPLGSALVAAVLIGIGAIVVARARIAQIRVGRGALVFSAALLLAVGGLSLGPTVTPAHAAADTVCEQAPAQEPPAAPQSSDTPSAEPSDTVTTTTPPTSPGPVPTAAPTIAPPTEPAPSPTASPTAAPTPTISPTVSPEPSPTSTPDTSTPSPSDSPTPSPSDSPTPSPSDSPTPSPSDSPSPGPTPTGSPTTTASGTLTIAMYPSPIWAIAAGGETLAMSDASGSFQPAGGWADVVATCTVRTVFDSTGGDPLWATTGSYAGFHLLAVDEAGVVRWTRHELVWHEELNTSGLITIAPSDIPAGTYRFIASTIPVAVGSDFADADQTYANTAYLGFSHVIESCPNGIVDIDGLLREGATGWYVTNRILERAIRDIDETRWVTFPLAEDLFMGATG